MSVHGRSLLDLSQEITAAQHRFLVDDLAKARAALGPGSADEPEVAREIVSDAIDLLEGPRPNYAEAAFWLSTAASLDPRYTKVARIIRTRVRVSVQAAMRMLDEDGDGVEVRS